MIGSYARVLATADLCLPASAGGCTLGHHSASCVVHFEGTPVCLTCFLPMLLLAAAAVVVCGMRCLQVHVLLMPPAADTIVPAGQYGYCHLLIEPTNSKPKPQLPVLLLLLHASTG
jgi:hypothetical protein